MQHFPAVAILGPRQVGKTTLVKTLKAEIGDTVLYFDMENDNHRFAATTNSMEFLKTHENQTLIIDEIQIVPELFASLRSAIDDNRNAGRFILLGSANFAMVKGVSETLAGRIAMVEIPQITLFEATEKGMSMEEHWLKWGFPEYLTIKNEMIRFTWINSFISTYVYRDLNLLFGINLNPQTVQKLWNMLAHKNGSIENRESLGRDLGITGTSIKKYCDFLEAAFLIRYLPAWHNNAGKRFIKSQKIYIRSGAILHHFLGIKKTADLYTHIGVGASWESYVIEQIHSYIPQDYSLYYYRTQHASEMDLVICRGGEVIYTVEIKISNTPALSKGFYQSVNDLNPKKVFIVTPNSATITSKEKYIYISLPNFLNEYIKKLY